MHLSHGLRWNGITFRCEVELSDAHAERSVDLSWCIFEGGLRLTDARVEGSLELTDAVVGELDLEKKPDKHSRRPFKRKFKSLDMSRARIEGSLAAYGIRVAGNWDFFDATIGGQLSANGGEVRGRFCGQSATVRGRLTCQPAGEQRCEIGGHAWLPGATVDGQADFRGARIGGELNLQGATILDGPVCGSAGEQRCEIEDDAWLAGATVEGAADFRGARIGGKLYLQGATLRGGLFCRPAGKQRCEIGSDVSLTGATVETKADFAGVRVDGDLVLNGATIKGDVAMWDRAWRKVLQLDDVEGAVPPPRARMRGDLHAKNATITGDVDLRRVDVVGSIRLPDATLDELRLGRPMDGDDVMRGEADGPTRCRELRLDGLRARGVVDRAGHAAPGHELGVGGIDDGVSRLVAREEVKRLGVAPPAALEHRAVDRVHAPVEQAGEVELGHVG